MQKFQVPTDLSAQIGKMNAKIREESPNRLIEIRPEFQPVGHKGRVLSVPVYDVIAEGSGKFSLTAQAAKDTILPIINGQIAEAARQAIEAQIEIEETARQNEAARYAEQLENERQKAEETRKAEAEKTAKQLAAIEAQIEEERQRAKKAAELAAIEAAEKQAQLEAQLAAIADAKAGRYNKASRVMAGFSMVLLALVCIVGTAMNFHNVTVLYGAIFHWTIIFLFAFILAFIPLIFAWVNDKDKVKQSTWILPVDYIVTVVLFILCNTDSQLVKSWGWLAENVNNVLLVASLMGVGFYAYQTYLIYNKLLNIVSNEKYKNFFMSLFD